MRVFGNWLLPLFSEPVIRFAASLSRAMPGIKRVVPPALRRVALNPFYRHSLWHLPDRQYMEQHIIPYVVERGAKHVLFVGCRKYTQGYWRFWNERGVEVWTLDIDPKAAPFGVPGRHIIGDASLIDTIEGCDGFDCVVLNGVFGYGIDDVAAIRRTFLGLARILEPNSLLVVGTNTDRVLDVRTLPECARLFSGLEHRRIPARQIFEGSFHVYDFLERNTRPADL